jgi:hypothetical protein
LPCCMLSTCWWSHWFLPPRKLQRILSNETKYILTSLKDDKADSNLSFANGTTTSVAPQSVEPSQLRLIEWTEITSIPISTCMPNDNTTSATPKAVELYHLQLSTISFPWHLMKQRPPQSRVLILVRLPSLSLHWAFIANTCLSIPTPPLCLMTAGMKTLSTR